MRNISLLRSLFMFIASVLGLIECYLRSKGH